MAANKIEKFDKEFKALTGWKKTRYIMAGVCFVAASIFVFDHLGFVDTDQSYKPDPIFSYQTLWIVNCVLGMIGGILFAPKKMLIVALSGLIAVASITGATLLYLSWRDSVYMIELIIPLLAGFTGLWLYNSLKRNSDDSN
jgi:hypothetical protein